MYRSVSLRVRVWWILAAVACLGCTAVLNAQSVLNPGFEEDLTDWDYSRDHDMSLASKEAAHAGAYGLRVNSGQKGLHSWLESTVVPVEPDKTYRLTFWARTISGGGVVVVSTRFYDVNSRPVQKSSPSAAVRQAPEWKQYSITTPVPPNAACFAVIIHSLAGEPVVADFDEFECQVVTP
jgi:hypothetical protein